MHNLSDNPEYVFEAKPMHDPYRFILHFTKREEEMDADINPEPNVYAFEKTVYVGLPEKMDKANVKIFNLMGQEVLSKNISGDFIHRLRLTRQSGYYQVAVQMGDHYISKMVYIK